MATKRVFLEQKQFFAVDVEVDGQLSPGAQETSAQAKALERVRAEGRDKFYLASDTMAPTHVVREADLLPICGSPVPGQGQSTCTRPVAHDGEHRCSAADVDLRNRLSAGRP